MSLLQELLHTKNERVTTNEWRKKTHERLMPKTID